MLSKYCMGNWASRKTHKFHRCSRLMWEYKHYMYIQLELSVRYFLYTVKKANLFSSFHENKRFWAGKTPFPWREYFSHGPQCVLYNAWTGIMFPSAKRKFAGDIIYPQRFFQFFRVEKYSLLGRRRTRKNFGMWKETKRTPSPPPSVQLLYTFHLSPNTELYMFDDN